MSEASQRLKEYREQQHLSQAEVAERLGVPQKQISDIERGRISLREDFLLRLYEKLGLSIDWLLTGKGGQFAGAAPGHAVDPGEVVGVLQQLRGLMETGVLAQIAEEKAEYGERRARRVPLFGIEGPPDVIYGTTGLPARAAAAERVACPDDLADPAAFACRLAGDSMAPEFREGTILFFAPAAEVASGDYACARIDSRSTFRQIFLEDNLVRLVPANRRFPELRLPRDKVQGIFRLAWVMAKY